MDTSILNYSSRKVASQKPICCEYKRYEAEAAKARKKRLKDQEAQETYTRGSKRYEKYIPLLWLFHISWELFVLQ